MLDLIDEVAIPFDPGQVSTKIKRGGSSYGCKRCIVAIPFDPGQVSTDVLREAISEFIKRVAIPFDPGQVSTNF